MSATSTSLVLPIIENEPFLYYAPGSGERASIDEAVQQMVSQMPFDVPCVVGGKEVRSNDIHDQLTPDSINTTPLCRWHAASRETVTDAIEQSLKAQREWANTPWYDRATIFLRAAALVTGKYRWQLVAATMLGQGKNVWQAEVDAIAELADFFRFSVKLVDDGYKQQPLLQSNDAVNRVEYRPLEGFTLAVSPFNFTAIGGNLVTVPTILGGVALWKPSPMSMYANYLTHRILLEAGVPGDVIQFIPGNAEAVVDQCINHKDFAALHFTGSTQVLRSLWEKIGKNIHKYRSYPRIVGETGGKNFHLVHPSANIQDTVVAAIRSGYEHQGQKCSALGRLYIPRSMERAGWVDTFVKEAKRIKQGGVTNHENFMGPVINEASFDRIMDIIRQAKEQGGEILVGGGGDKSKGLFVEPTLIKTDNLKSLTMVREIFGPVITLYVYEDDDWESLCASIDETTEYALTGAIFCNDRKALKRAEELLRYSAGNLYLNEKTTGAVVGQHPFGGNRSSGTNDKSGTWAHFSRFASARTIKDSFAEPVMEFLHPSNAS